MRYDVFISHASVDCEIAGVICAHLEQAGLSCWIAPRNVTPGRSFPGEISRGISASKVFVIVLSKSANHSDHVLREVQLADSSKIPILQFRIDSEKASDDLKYYLNLPHWLDATKQPLEPHLHNLLQSVKRLAAGNEAAPEVAADVPGSTATSSGSPAGEPENSNTTNFEDPNNHVPEVTPDDGWGDDETVEESVLPAAKRIPEKKAAGKPKAGDASFEVRELTATADDAPEKPDEAVEEPEAEPGLFEDPNNHVPKLTAVDDWGDLDSPVLPKRRAAAERPAGYAAKADDQDDKGVEIGIKVVERVEDQEVRGPVQRLEVLEHTPKLPVPEGGALPRIVPKQVIEKSAVQPDEVAADSWHGRNPEAETWGRQRSVQMRWIVISGIFLAVGVIAGVLIVPRLGWKNEGGTRTSFSNLEVMETPMLEGGAAHLSELGEGIEAKAKVLVEAYAKAKTPDEVLPLVRDRERVEKMLRERWTPMEVPAGWHVPDESKWEILRTGDREYGFLTGLLPDVTPFRFYVVQKGDQAFLDWEASTGFSETTFGDLSKRQGEGGVVRGYVSSGDLYTFSLPEADYQCFRITSANAETSVWGYAKRTDPVAEKVAAPFVPGVIPREILTEYPMTLKLTRGPAESLPNQWIITEMLHMEWLTP